MADFTLKKRRAFTFNLGDGKEDHSIPPASKLPFEEVVMFRSLKDAEDVETYAKTREFVLKYCPELEGSDLGDLEYLEIFGAYVKSQNDMGES